jgi:hypothetical protein
MAKAPAANRVDTLLSYLFPRLSSLTKNYIWGFQSQASFWVLPPVYLRFSLLSITEVCLFS